MLRAVVGRGQSLGETRWARSCVGPRIVHGVLLGRGLLRGRDYYRVLSDGGDCDGDV